MTSRPKIRLATTLFLVYTIHLCLNNAGTILMIAMKNSPIIDTFMEMGLIVVLETCGVVMSILNMKCFIYCMQLSGIALEF